ncbi:Serine/threonine-protein phosphatase 4 regulatory subunit 2 [Hypsizygus marmoreus]|uniref:Serine/threonine-protein phosphatase 4 regulatory subunit 2 n=1 Tax=Hypsizygus marmoreus TaxID=39966 RepID=A0A369JZJ5_HYPMA|nr:Serine/threonine-protein phosphatase 4 regulatory subunit 2 [Hypsizygus marmoreus]
MEPSSDFQWLPEYDVLLDKIANTDVVDSDWTILRSAIKHKIGENVAMFLADKYRPSPPTFQPLTLASGGLKLPPFPTRKEPRPHMNEVPVSYMTEEQANELKGYIFAQLDEFESQPPFTIQRVCELCLHPKHHYSSVGKYLRAVEKSLLVTSTWDSFPPLSEVDLDPNGRSVFALGSTRQSAPATPLFSPIPFLHDDARRSKSRSPPPSPLALCVASPDGVPEPLEPRALGLVDELDDPSPGHMSDHPTPLTSVTTLGEGSEPRPFLGSLEQRFVKGGEEPPDQAGSDDMVLDDDKENKAG